ncbi:MAG TPA: copper resistance protein NlpE N-terminal domain-containing protein [Luteimonas sp.]|nr:copper resistance protein NlpE N-terminal domain-containing protein [Luteimonas sp.]
MARLRPCLLLLALSLAGCGRGAAPAAPALPADGRIEWQGLLACADCDGIQTRLVLLRSGELRNYTLTETYLAEDNGARFVEGGHWQRDRDLLRLRGDTGDTRVFALLPDGRLQPRDRHGREFRPREGDFLAPVTTPTPP